MSKLPFGNKLAQFSREQYADWLWRGLRSFYSSPPTDRIGSFEYVDRVIRVQESVCEGLAVVYEKYVPDERRLFFRQAVGDVLRQQGNYETALIDAFRDLIYLLARIRATESLDALLPTVGAGQLGKRYPEVLYETLGVLKLLAPSRYAYETALDLVDSSNFDDGYLFEAIKVLVECQPSRTATVIEKLLPRLNTLHKAAHDSGGDEWIAFSMAAEDWAREVVLRAPSSWIKELWENADHLPDEMWFFELFFTRDDIPIDLTCDESSERYTINYGSRRFRVNVKAKDCWTRRYIQRISVFHKTLAWCTDPTDPAARIQIVNDTHLGPKSRIRGTYTGAKMSLATALNPRLKKLAPKEHPSVPQP